MSDLQAIISTTDSIDGWLLPNAIRLTGELLEYQSDLGLVGGILEVGVWRGRYLTALALLAPERRLFGVDVWLHDQEEDVASTVKANVPGIDLTLLRMNTQDVDHATLAARIGTDIHWVSLDGDHSVDGVTHDLEICLSLLAPGGIIAIDDFLNPLTLGVTEAVVEACRRGGFEPIIVAANKLFVTSKGWGELYRTRIRMLVATDRARDLLGSHDLSSRTTHLAGHVLYCL